MNEECVRERRIRKKKNEKKIKMHDQNKNRRTPD